LFLANIVFSLVPPSDRPLTILPHSIEHLFAFFLLGLAFGLGYAKRYLLTMLLLIAFAALIELAQIFVPGRHARFSDFLTDAIAATFGVSLPLVLRRWNNQV
jgi:VanZ family protein